MNQSNSIRTFALIAALLCFEAAEAEDVIAIYPAITSSNYVAIEGRVVKKRASHELASTDSKGRNLERNMGLMINNECKRCPVIIHLDKFQWNTSTDREGYFRIEAGPLPEFANGWHVVTANTDRGEGVGGVLKVSSLNVHGLISDIDDTIQVTEVNSKRRMLKNTFLYNATQREVVPGIVDFYRSLAQENADVASAPMIYLSASPRQLHSNIQGFLDHNGFPRGVLITKRVTDDRTSEPLIDQVAYKTKKIEGLLTTLPTVRFTLVGDDGERDPEIYDDIRKRFPDRIDAVWIRRVNPDPKRIRIDGQGSLDDILQTTHR